MSDNSTLANAIGRIVRAGDRRRATRFHTARGEPIPIGAWLRLPVHARWILGPRLIGRRPVLPWIPFSAIRHLDRILRPDARVLEIGSGFSTLWLARRCGRLVSIEADAQWYDRVRDLLAAGSCAHVDLRYPWRAEEMCDFSDFPDRSLDLVFVDGGPREACLAAGMAKLRDGGTVYVDNTDDADIAGRCREALEDLACSRGGRLSYFRDFSPGNLYASEGIALTLRAA